MPIVIEPKARLAGISKLKVVLAVRNTLGASAVALALGLAVIQGAGSAAALGSEKVSGATIGGGVLPADNHGFPSLLPWECAADTFYIRRGNSIHTFDGATGQLATPPVILSTGSSADINALALNPQTGTLYGVNARNGSGVAVSTDGTVFPLFDFTAQFLGWDFAGGTFTSDGYWLLANASGAIATVDLTDPTSPTYGEIVSTGTSQGSVTFLSGDFAYRSADDRVYFHDWGTTTLRFWSMSRQDFVTGGSNVPIVLGAEIEIPEPARSQTLATTGSKMGFTSNGDVWVSPALLGPAFPDNFIEPVWLFDGDIIGDPTQTLPPLVVGDNLPNTGSGSDGFSCFATTSDPEPTPSPSPEQPELAATGAVDMTWLAIGTFVLLAGGALTLLRRRAVTR